MAITGYDLYFPINYAGQGEVTTLTPPSSESGVTFTNDQGVWSSGEIGFATQFQQPSTTNSVSFFASKTASGTMAILGDAVVDYSEVSLWINDTTLWVGDRPNQSQYGFAHELGATFGLTHFVVTVLYNGDHTYTINMYADNVIMTQNYFPSVPADPQFDIQYIGCTEGDDGVPYWNWQGILGDIKVYNDYILTAQDRSDLLAGGYLQTIYPNIHDVPYPISLSMALYEPTVETNTWGVTVELDTASSVITPNPVSTSTIDFVLWDNDLDPFGDGSLIQSWTFEGALPQTNLQGTNSFTTDWTPATIEDGGLGKYPQWTTRTAGYYEPATSGGHGIDGDVPASFTIFFRASYYEGLSFGFGGYGARYNVQIDKYMGAIVSQNVTVSLHKDAVSLDCGAVADGLHSIQYTYDGAGTSRIYLDGVLKGSLSLTMKFNAGNGLHAFCYYSASDDYLTNFDQVCVWNKQLSQTEATLVANTKAFVETPVTINITDVISLSATSHDVTAIGNSAIIDLNQISTNVTAVDPIVIDDNYSTSLTDESLDPFGDGSLTQSFTFNSGKLDNEQGTNEFVSPINGTIVPHKFGDGIQNTYLQTDTTLNGHGISGNVPCSVFYWIWNADGVYHEFSFGGVGQANNVQISVWGNSSNQLSFYVDIDNGAYQSLAITRSAIGNAYNLIGFTYNQNQLYININTSSAYTIARSVTFNPNAPITIKGDTFLTVGVGKIDQIMVFNKAVWATERAILFNDMQDSQNISKTIDLEDTPQLTLNAKNPTIEIVYPTNVTVDADSATISITLLDITFDVVEEVFLETTTITLTAFDVTVEENYNAVFESPDLDLVLELHDPEIVVPAKDETVTISETLSITVVLIEPIIEVFAGRRTPFEIIQVVDIVKIRYTFDIVEEVEQTYSSKIITRSKY